MKQENDNNWLNEIREELKDFEDFRQRMALDRKMLDYNHYEYGKHIFR